jgi:hypothetical protein
MPGSAGRQLGTWFNVLAGMLAIGAWASNALRAAFGDEDLSIRAFFVYFSLVLIGFTIATLLDAFTAPARARRRDSGGSAQTLGDSTSQNLLSALWILGFAAGPILDASRGALEWTLLIVGSLAGGLTIGVAFAAASEQRHASTSEVHRPTRYDRW